MQEPSLAKRTIRLQPLFVSPCAAHAVDLLPSPVCCLFLPACLSICLPVKPGPHHLLYLSSVITPARLSVCIWVLGGSTFFVLTYCVDVFSPEPLHNTTGCWCLSFGKSLLQSQFSWLTHMQIYYESLHYLTTINLLWISAALLYKLISIARLYMKNTLKSGMEMYR